MGHPSLYTVSEESNSSHDLLNVVHVIFFFPIVPPPLTWLFLLEHHYILKLKKAQKSLT